MFTKEQIIKNWKDSGLLEGLPKEKIEPVALDLEQMAVICLKELPSKEYGRLDTLAFPVVRRVSQRTENVNISHLWNYLKEAYRKEGWIYEAQSNLNQTKSDPEAEWVSNICEEYLQKFHSNEKKQLSEEKQRMLELAGLLKS